MPSQASKSLSHDPVNLSLKSERSSFVLDSQFQESVFGAKENFKPKRFFFASEDLFLEFK